MKRFSLFLISMAVSFAILALIIFAVSASAAEITQPKPLTDQQKIEVLKARLSSASYAAEFWRQQTEAAKAQLQSLSGALNAQTQAISQSLNLDTLVRKIKLDNSASEACNIDDNLGWRCPEPPSPPATPAK